VGRTHYYSGRNVAIVWTNLKNSLNRIRSRLIVEYERYYNKDLFKLRCDFYLNDYDYYIEYNGMTNKNYDKKKTLLSNNSINNVHYSDNLTDIKEFIQKLT